MSSQEISAETPRIILIEDHGVYRDAVLKVLSSRKNCECLGSFSNVEDALDALDAGLVADVILLDLGLPGMGGIRGIPLLREKLPEVRVIVLTAFTDQEKVFSALEAGAHGYLIKSGSASRLVEVLKEVIEGGTPLDAKIAGMVLSTFQKLKPIASEDNLSPREHEILKLVAQGLTKKAVAYELDISLSSVATYLRRIFDKLHVHSLPSAVSEAIRRGWLDFSE